MTTPTQRTRAVLLMERLALRLGPFKLPYHKDDGRVMVPQYLLRLIAQALRHYPTRYDLERSHEALPDVWGPPDGDV